MFEGLGLGIFDDDGKEIKCGDRVSLYQFRKGYTERHAEDGWGRTVELSRNDQYRAPDREKTTAGTVVYNPRMAQFIVIFDEETIDSENRERGLFGLVKSVNHKRDRFVVTNAKVKRRAHDDATE